VNGLVEGLDNLLKLGHPRQAQMAVLQENPLSELLTFLDHVLSGFLLTGTKGDSGHTRVHTDFTTVLVPRGVGISSRGEHEN